MLFGNKKNSQAVIVDSGTKNLGTLMSHFLPPLFCFLFFVRKFHMPPIQWEEEKEEKFFISCSTKSPICLRRRGEEGGGRGQEIWEIGGKKTPTNNES